MQAVTQIIHAHGLVQNPGARGASLSLKGAGTVPSGPLHHLCGLDMHAGIEGTIQQWQQLPLALTNDLITVQQLVSITIVTFIDDVEDEYYRAEAQFIKAKILSLSETKGTKLGINCSY